MSEWVFQSKHKVSAELCSFWKLQGRIVCLLFPLLEATCAPWRVAPSSDLRVHHPTRCFSTPARLPRCEDSGGYTGFNGVIQDHLPSSGSFVTSAKSLSPSKVACSEVPGIGTWTSLGRHYSVCHATGPPGVLQLPPTCWSFLYPCCQKEPFIT